MPKNVIKVLDKLVAAGYEAYLVGGSVRDIVLGKEPKDFDIATSAYPEQVKKLFRNCRLIGRRFRLAHIFFGREIIEVATFRAGASGKPHDAGNHILSSSGQIVRDNIYGTLAEDAARRDFTVNALYYDWRQDTIIDFHSGMEDIENKVIKLIGAPKIRYQEDPVRILRAVRFAAKLEFKIDQSAKMPIKLMSAMLQNVPAARLFEEFLKLFQHGFAARAFAELEKYGLLQNLLPQTHKALQANQDFKNFAAMALTDTDKRIAKQARTTPAYLIAVFLWAAVQKYTEDCSEQPAAACVHQAGKKALRIQKRTTAIPKRFAHMARDIWELQPRLTRTRGKSPFKVLQHPKFRAAYDFLLLRHRSGESGLEELTDWWTNFQFTSIKNRRLMAGFNNRKRANRPK